MLLPLMGFTFMLIIVGALASLVAIGDPRNARLAPSIGFPSLLAGAGALLLAMALGLLGTALDKVAGLEVLAGIGSVSGYVLGGVGGAVLGFILASRRARKMNF